MPRKRSGKRPGVSAGAAQKGQVRIIGGEWRGEPYPVGPDGLATPLFVGNRRFAVARLPTRWDGQPPSASADPVRLPSPSTDTVGTSGDQVGSRTWIHSMDREPQQ